ncbi:UNVERIFIED_CONTAM: hypothetical protein FKN15_041049 [Acipenser sinensis]
MKECMLAVVNEIISDEKIKSSVVSSIQKIPLSDTSAMRRVEVLGTEVFDTFLDRLKKSRVHVTCIDESTDNTDNAQLCVSVRLFDGNCFRDEKLALLRLESYATGEVISQKITSFFEEHGLDLNKVCLLVTDGAPSMIGSKNGMIARLSALASQMQSLHCIIHQSVLCGKLCNELKDTMNTVTAIINFIRSTSSLQHRLFRLLQADMSADHHDLLVHNDVRWITKGKALNRFCDLKDEIIEFLNNSSHKNAERYSNMVRDDEFMAKVCFLSDIFGHLNTLNLELQGRDKTIIDLVEKLNAFQSKLSLFSSDLHLQKLLHFPQLCNFTASSSVKVTNVMSDFLIKLNDKL